MSKRELRRKLEQAEYELKRTRVWLTEERAHYLMMTRAYASFVLENGQLGDHRNVHAAVQAHWKEKTGETLW